MIHFDNTISIGTTLHAIVMVLIVLICYRRLIKVLCQIEAKEDLILNHQKEVLDKFRK